MLPKGLFVTTAKNSLYLSRKNALNMSQRCSVRKGLISPAQTCRKFSRTERWLGITGGIGLGLSASVFASPILCECE